MADGEDVKPLGQNDYEEFCRNERESRGCLWNSWETLTLELKAEWASAELTGLGNPGAKMREMSPCVSVTLPLDSPNARIALGGDP